MIYWFDHSRERSILLSFNSLNIFQSYSWKWVFVLQHALGCRKICFWVNDITIKLWGIVVHHLLSWIGVFCLINTLPLMSNNTFGNFEVVKWSHDVSVHTVVWDCKILWVVDFLGIWVLVLTTSSTGADWVWGDLDSWCWGNEKGNFKHYILLIIIKNELILL